KSMANGKRESKKIGYAATEALLIVALIAGSVPRPVWASDHSTDQQRPIRLYATARFGPIGAIKLNSLSGAAVAIDGRLAQGEASIWGGEMIQVGDDSSVSVGLASRG